MEVTQWQVGQIAVRDRARSDIGDLESLMASMDRLGQLQPIAVEADGVLLFGERRLRAAQALGWDEIAVTVIRDLGDLERLLVERDENTERAEMSALDKSRLFTRIEELQARLIGQGKRTDLLPTSEDSDLMPTSENFSEVREESSRARAKAAKAAGISHASVRKIRAIEAAADDETAPEEVRGEAKRQVKELSKPGAKIDPAHKKVQAVKRRAEKTLRAGLGPGQCLPAPPPPKDTSLTRRLVDGINKGQGLDKLAAEVKEMIGDLEIDDKTIKALQGRLRSEIKARSALIKALSEYIAERN